MIQRRVGPLELFRTFTILSLSGFGGVMPWAYMTIVEKKQWLTDQEFAELLSLGQILPGANITNLSSMLGYRFAGIPGVFAAVGGLLTFPFLLILILGVLYQKYGQLHAVQGALRGITAIASGLIISIGIKLARKQPRNFRGLLFGLLTLAAVGLLGWPLMWVVFGLIPLALFIEWRLIL